MKEKWLVNWQKAKKEFEDLTGKKKPSEKVLVVFRKSSGVESALKACDNGITGLEENWAKGDVKRKQSQVAMRKAIDVYKKTAADYSSLLDQAINKEVTDKEEKTVYYRGLKMLKAKLGQYATSYEASLAFDTAEQAKGEQYADKHWKIAETKLRAGIATATACCKTAAAAVAKNGAEAWPDFITEIGNGIRQLQWALNDVRKAIGHGVQLASPDKPDQALSQLDGKLPRGPGQIDSNQMLAYLKELANIAKDVKAAYKL